MVSKGTMHGTIMGVKGHSGGGENHELGKLLKGRYNICFGKLKKRQKSGNVFVFVSV